MSFQDTAQQTDFYSALTTTTSNLALVARAGCGKTSTILRAVDLLAAREPRAEIIVCAYNKAIADEVKEKLRLNGHTDWKTVSASTLHGLGFGLLRPVFQPKVDEKKVGELCDAQHEEVFAEYKRQICAMVAVAKQAGVGYFEDMPINKAKVWMDLADRYGLDGFDDDEEVVELLTRASQHIYTLSLKQTDVIDYDDMILFPLIKNLRVRWGKDYMFLDEAQDLSRARQELAMRFLKKGTGRMIVVGDDRQAIYGFSGADSNALNNMIKRLKADVMPLSITWRCPRAVVAEAQRWVPDIQAAPTAKDGEVLRLAALPDDLGEGDAVLCRNMAPLVTIAFFLIKQGKAAKVEGRAIGEGLKALATRWKVVQISALLNKLEEYRDREVAKAEKAQNEGKVDEINDKVDCLVMIAQVCLSKGQHNVSDVVFFIDSLFADGVKGAITLATYHRSKGREWLRVYLWEHSLRCPARQAKQEWQLEQEDNLAYVAVTRAQSVLGFVGG